MADSHSHAVGDAHKHGGATHRHTRAVANADI